MKTVSIEEAKTELSRLVDEAANGEGFVIAKAGKPLVKVVPIDEVPAKQPKKTRRIGFLDGQFFIPDDLDSDLGKEIADLFYGEQK